MQCPYAGRLGDVRSFRSSHFSRFDSGDVEEIGGVPYLLGDLAVKLSALDAVGRIELSAGLEVESTVLAEVLESWVLCLIPDGVPNARPATLGGGRSELCLAKAQTNVPFLSGRQTCGTRRPSAHRTDSITPSKVAPRQSKPGMTTAFANTKRWRELDKVENPQKYFAGNVARHESLDDLDRQTE